MSFGILPIEPIESCGVSADRHTDQNVADVPSGDLVSRQLLIGAIKKCGEEKIYPQALIETIKALPSADRPTDNSCQDCPIYSADRPSNVLQEKKPTPIEDYMIGKSRSADRPTEYNLETIADIVKQLGHLDGCIADILDRQKVNSTEWVAEKEKEFEELNRPQVNSNSAEEQIAETCDRPKGEWIRKENNVSWWVECSKCGEKPLLNVYNHTYEKTPYCPNCGADMRGADR